MRRLGTDQLEALKDFADHSEGAKAFLYELENACLYMDADVLKSPIIAGRENEVLYKKLKAEGGRKILEEARKILMPRAKTTK